MAQEDKLTSFLRRTTSTPTMTLFRFTNFELYSRCVLTGLTRVCGSLWEVGADAVEACPTETTWR